jgi:hypothetical protein
VAETTRTWRPHMIAGHFGFAAAVKSHERQTPLWALMFAAVWLDVVFVPLLLTGREIVRPVDAAHHGYGANLIYADYTHSLVGMLVLSAILGGLAGLLWGRRSGVVVSLVAASHWLLDLLVHRGDMPVLPGDVGNLPRLGFGLWRYPLVSAGVELTLILIGAYLYWRAGRQVVKANGRGALVVSTAAFLIAVFGVLILWMDFTSA